MDLKIIGSSSKGNAYILENNQEALLIECGVNFYDIKRALEFNLRNVVGCLVTHEHGDHAKSMKDVISAGISVYASAGTINAMGVAESHRAIKVKSGDVFAMGGFKVKAFDVKHDVTEPLGFVINHEETGNILFLTDSYYCEYNFDQVGLHNIIIEANYCKNILDQRVRDGANPQFLRDRVITSHMSLATCKQMLSANDLSQVNNIVLIHLSDGNSDAKRFKKEVEEQTGKQVHIADAGQIIYNFNKTPF